MAGAEGGTVDPELARSELVESVEGVIGLGVIGLGVIEGDIGEGLAGSEVGEGAGLLELLLNSLTKSLMSIIFGFWSSAMRNI